MGRALVDKRGFTLTELLVVVAIIVLLTSIVVPNIMGRITVARMHAAEDQISEIEAALTAYHADFGEYPGDVFPTEDKNNNGKLDDEDTNHNGILDPGEDLNHNGALDNEDIGVDVDGDGVADYAIPEGTPAVGNGRLDHGDGVINILDLEWALKTTAKHGPYMESIPLDPWGNKYVYWAPLKRPTYNPNDTPNDKGNLDYLYIDPYDLDTPADATLGLPARTLCTEDKNGNGKLDPGEDIGIADYDVDASVTDVSANFRNLRAGAGNGVLDQGDDDNKDNIIQAYIQDNSTPIQPPVDMELGNKDISPDGLARNLGYYIYSVGRNGKDETATGYEDINLNSQLDSATTTPLTVDASPGTFDEDINGDGTLDTGYEDTGIDGIPGTHDRGEDDWNADVGNPTITTPDPPGTPSEEFGTTSSLSKYHYNKHHDPNSLQHGPNARGFDIGGDDINSWNKERPWRKNTSYGG